MSELDYQINYAGMVDALQIGGVEGAQAFKSSRTSRGLGTPLDTEKYVRDKEDRPSLQKRILDSMDNVQKENESMAEKMKALKLFEKDSVTEDLEPYMRDPNMKTSGDIAKFIAEFEKFSPKAYDDYGRLSIGYGTEASNINQTMTKEEALIAMNKNIVKARNIVLDEYNIWEVIHKKIKKIK